ncbi:uncharacterized protein [Littorina saxatilis]|uniref:Uncharacterized protein n=1 Tax=Littorina saxatilis TaxID=31220 RepID=A0AAN9BXK5_9CAEN
MGILSKTVAVICGCLLWTIGSSDGASPAGVHPCPMYEFWDHGTEHCEPCRGICDQAKHRNTVEYCVDMCPAYAQVLWPPKSPTLKPPNNNDGNNNNNNNTSEFPPNTWIGIVALGLVCILVSAVFLVKRKAIVAKIRGNNPRPTIPGQTAVVLQPVTPVPTPGDGSLATSIGGGSGGTAGIQEQGGPCPEAAGNHCYQIFPHESESDPLLKQQPRIPAPIPVSPEGQSGDHAMALLHSHSSGGAYSTPRSCFFPTTSYYSSPPDMDSTEPKTLQSSLDRIDCLLPGADGTMRTSRI